MAVDPVCGAFINFEPAEMVDMTDVPDPFTKVLTDGALAAALGRNGHRHVSRLNEELADIHARAAKLFKHETPSSPTEWDEIIDSQPLEKAASHSNSRKQTLTLWMVGEIALGKTASELIEHAERTDPATARELRAIAAELKETNQ